MAAVKIRTGAVSATDDPESLPVEKWDQLVRARYRYLAITLPSDCSCLLQFIHEAERLRMWEKVEHVDMRTGDRRPYEGIDDFVRNAFELDPEKVQWAKKGWEMLKPTEPVPYEIAATVGKQFEAKETKQGNNQHRKISDATQSSRAKSNGISDRTQRKLDRLAKDRPDLLAKVNAGDVSVNKAAIEAGIVHVPTRLEKAIRLIEKFTPAQREAFNRYWQSQSD